MLNLVLIEHRLPPRLGDGLSLKGRIDPVCKGVVQVILRIIKSEMSAVFENRL